jgi:hypothetical protein
MQATRTNPRKTATDPTSKITSGRGRLRGVLDTATQAASIMQRPAVLSIARFEDEGIKILQRFADNPPKKKEWVCAAALIVAIFRKHGPQPANREVARVISSLPTKNGRIAREDLAKSYPLTFIRVFSEKMLSQPPAGQAGPGSGSEPETDPEPEDTQAFLAEAPPCSNPSEVSQGTLDHKRRLGEIARLTVWTCSELGFPYDLSGEACQLLETSGMLQATSRLPITLAGAAIFVAAKRRPQTDPVHDLSLQRLAGLLGICVVSVRKASQDLASLIGQLLPAAGDLSPPSERR